MLVSFDEGTVMIGSGQDKSVDDNSGGDRCEDDVTGRGFEKKRMHFRLFSFCHDST